MPEFLEKREQADGRGASLPKFPDKREQADGRGAPCQNSWTKGSRLMGCSLPEFLDKREQVDGMLLAGFTSFCRFLAVSADS